jgi:hypothetical protein
VTDNPAKNNLTLNVFLHPDNLVTMQARDGEKIVIDLSFDRASALDIAAKIEKMALLIPAVTKQ